jgi:hypothetical protein
LQQQNNSIQINQLPAAHKQIFHMGLPFFRKISDYANKITVAMPAKMLNGVVRAGEYVGLRGCAK